MGLQGTKDQFGAQKMFSATDWTVHTLLNKNFSRQHQTLVLDHFSYSLRTAHLYEKDIFGKKTWLRSSG